MTKISTSVQARYSDTGQIILAASYSDLGRRTSSGAALAAALYSGGAAIGHFPLEIVSKIWSGET